MRYETAVGHLRRIADECARWSRLPEEPLVVAAYVFGDLLRGPAQLERTQLAFVLELPPDEVTWYAKPAPAAGFAQLTGIGKLPLEWYWRPAAWPVWNHHIRDPVRFWSLDGVDEDVLAALAARRFDRLRREGAPGPEEELRWLEEEAAASLAHLRRVVDAYWDRGWRAEHKGGGISPEDHLWRAAFAYLDLRAGLDAAGRRVILRPVEPSEG